MPHPSTSATALDNHQRIERIRSVHRIGLVVIAALTIASCSSGGDANRFFDSTDPVIADSTSEPVTSVKEEPPFSLAGLPSADLLAIDITELCTAMGKRLASRLPGWSRLDEPATAQSPALVDSIPATFMAPTAECSWYEIDVPNATRLRLGFSFTNTSRLDVSSYISNWYDCCAGAGWSAESGTYAGFPAVWTSQSGYPGPGTPVVIFVDGAILDVHLYGPVDGSVSGETLDPRRHELLEAFLEIWADLE